jgi:hypothetical protein
MIKLMFILLYDLSDYAMLFESKLYNSKNESIVFSVKLQLVIL